MELVAILTWCALLGLIPAAIAKRKGRSFFGWWVFGALFFVVALVAVIVMRHGHKGEKKCGYCAEWIKQEAIVCPNCRSSQLPAVRIEPTLTVG